MTPERWRQITDVFHAARVRDAATRVVFLDEVCAADPSLRADVDAMLAADREAERFGEWPVFGGVSTLPRPNPGATLGPYRIDEAIGAGGMGEVFKAHDPRLGRAIAIKVLYSDPLCDPYARFHLLREARSAAALNHPHVCTIHDVGESDGVTYIAMELIEGKPLSQLIPDGGFPVEDVLRYGIQIADAMAHAHSRGILHRDLKPANVMISDLGTPKILDFGLARTFSGTEQPVPELQSGRFGAGLVTGTAAYMSPEQATGKVTDERSDVFSFGVLLYEIATGRAPFTGASPMEVLDAVLNTEPEPVAKIRRDLPSGLSAVLQKALAKDPSRRYQRMSDVALALRRLQRPALVKRPAVVASAAGITLIAFAIWFVPRFRVEISGPAATRISQVTTLHGLEYSPTWSHDGRAVAYVSDAPGNLDIYVQRIGEEPVRVTDSDADDAQPAWSPDGSRIAFVSARAYPQKRLSVLIGMSRLQSILPLQNGDIWIMPASVGEARRVAQDAYDPAWSPDGKELVYAAAPEGRWGLWIRQVDTTNQPPRLVVKPAPSMFDTGLPVRISPTSSVTIQPAWSPDGNWIAFTAGRDPALRVFVVPSKGGAPLVVTDAGHNSYMPSWSPDGRWLYFSSERSGRINLFKTHFQDGRFGPKLSVTAGAGADLQARIDPDGSRIAYASVRDVLDVWEYDLESAKAVRVTSETTEENNARPSPDGTWMAFASDRVNGHRLWLLDRRTGSLSQPKTAPNAFPYGARWSWHGRHLFYRTETDAIWLYDMSTDTSRKVYENNDRVWDFCVSARDMYLVHADGSGGIMRVEIASARAEVVGRFATGNPGDLACSPDGQWVAAQVQRNEKDRDIWLIPFTGGAPRHLTPGDNEDSHPTWSADSRSIYFLRNHQDIYVVPRTGGEAKPVTRYQSFGVTLDYPAVSGDGKKILFTRTDKTGDIYILEQPQDRRRWLPFLK